MPRGGVRSRPKQIALVNAIVIAARKIRMKATEHRRNAVMVVDRGTGDRYVVTVQRKR